MILKNLSGKQVKLSTKPIPITSMKNTPNKWFICAVLSMVFFLIIFKQLKATMTVWNVQGEYVKSTKCVSYRRLKQ